MDLGFGKRQRTRRFELDGEVEDLIVFAAADRQHAMRRDGLRGFAIVVIHRKLLLGIFDLIDFAPDNYALRHHPLATAFADIGVLADPFREHVTRAFERLVDIRDAKFGIDEGGGEFRERGIGGRCSQRYTASGSRPFARAMVALVRRFGL